MIYSEAIDEFLSFEIIISLSRIVKCSPLDEELSSTFRFLEGLVVIAGVGVVSASLVVTGCSGFVVIGVSSVVGGVCCGGRI